MTFLHLSVTRAHSSYIRALVERTRPSHFGVVVVFRNSPSPMLLWSLVALLLKVAPRSCCHFAIVFAIVATRRKRLISQLPSTNKSIVRRLNRKIFNSFFSLSSLLMQYIIILSINRSINFINFINFFYIIHPNICVYIHIYIYTWRIRR